MRAADIIAQIAPLGFLEGRRIIDEILADLTAVELAALACEWATIWAEEHQIPPLGDWRSWGFLTARGFGKTIACSHYLNAAVERGEARWICLIAQDEQACEDINVNGPSGLIATAPPWNKPEYFPSDLTLYWPNGARGFVRTPREPGKIRGLDYDHSWLSEIQSWPVTTREESLTNAFISTRIGLSRVLWDATPKRRHPLLKQLLEAADDRNFVVRGTTDDNPHLSDEYKRDLEKRMPKGSTREKEERLGIMLDEAEKSLWKQEWLDAHRAPLPLSFVRRAISLDVAVSDRPGADTTGLVVGGLTRDGKACPTKDLSEKMPVEKWAELTIDEYFANQCDVLVAETNKGGRLVVQTIRATAAVRNKGIEVRVVGPKDRLYHHPRVINIREVYAKGSKAERAEPVAEASRTGLVFFPQGAPLAGLEDTLTTWDSDDSEYSPGDLDAFVHLCVELLGLESGKKQSRSEGIGGIAAKVNGGGGGGHPGIMAVNRVLGTGGRKL
jgi:phage terminase large subunit-like protein